MSPQETSPVIVHAIQLAIAPVFLLTGIGAMLGDVYLATHAGRFETRRITR